MKGVLQTGVLLLQLGMMVAYHRNPSQGGPPAQEPGFPSQQFPNTALITQPDHQDINIAYNPTIGKCDKYIIDGHRESQILEIKQGLMIGIYPTESLLNLKVVLDDVYYKLHVVGTMVSLLKCEPSWIRCQQTEIKGMKQMDIIRKKTWNYVNITESHEEITVSINHNDKVIIMNNHKTSKGGSGPLHTFSKGGGSDRGVKQGGSIKHGANDNIGSTDSGFNNQGGHDGGFSNEGGHSTTGQSVVVLMAKDPEEDDSRNYTLTYQVNCKYQATSIDGAGIRTNDPNDDPIYFDSTTGHFESTFINDMGVTAGSIWEDSTEKSTLKSGFPVYAIVLLVILALLIIVAVLIAISQLKKRRSADVNQHTPLQEQQQTK